MWQSGRSAALQPQESWRTQVLNPLHGAVFGVSAMLPTNMLPIGNAKIWPQWSQGNT
jgi:hypothetical protein